MLRSGGGIEQFLGRPVEVNDEILKACRNAGSLGALMFDLYRETGHLVTVLCSAYYENRANRIALPRNQAICNALLVRISKLMVSVVKLSSEIEHGETVQILNRCLIESSINLQFLVQKDDEGIYDDFVRSGLSSERELFDLIQSNIKDRDGEELVIEQDMLQSIRNTCQNSGLSIEEINPRAGNWGGSFKDKLTALGIEEAYPILQKTTSQSVHGSWSDLITNHLRINEFGYEPDFDHRYTDGELLHSGAIMALQAARAYVNGFFDSRNAQVLEGRMDSLQDRIMQAEMSRGEWEAAPG